MCLDNLRMDEHRKLYGEVGGYLLALPLAHIDDIAVVKDVPWILQLEISVKVLLVYRHSC